MATHSSVFAWRIPGTGNLVGCRLWGCTESDTTEVTQQQQHLSSIFYFTLVIIYNHSISFIVSFQELVVAFKYHPLYQILFSIQCLSVFNFSQKLEQLLNARFMNSVLFKSNSYNFTQISGTYKEFKHNNKIFSVTHSL